VDQLTLDKIFDGSAQYAVPVYQRGYEWTNEQTQEFFDDLDSISNESSADKHFFGFMLSVSNPDDPDKIIKIVDGQQRMTTVMLFLICARNFFHKHRKLQNAVTHFEFLQTRINISHDRQKLVLTLGRANQKFYQDLLSKLCIEQDLIDKWASTSSSNKLLAAAYKNLSQCISGKSIDEVYKYVVTLLTRFEIYRYKYPNEQKAYRVFDLVNNRGIHLRESDHIKNYLFEELERTVNSDTIDEYDEVWSNMYNIVTGSAKARYKTLDRFLHHYLLATKGYGDTIDPKLSNMHKAFRRLINDLKQSPEKIIRDLHRWAQILSMLRNTNEKSFEGNITIIHYLKKISSVNAVYVYPIILASYDRYWDRGHATLFELTVMMCFKYHMRVKVIGTGLSLSDYERKMYEITKEILRDKDGTKLSKIISDLIQSGKHYPSPEQLYVNLINRPISGTKNVAALLQEVEYAHTRQRAIEPVTVEHIMPKTMGEWETYLAKHNQKHFDPNKSPKDNVKIIHSKYVDYLGNQTLLSLRNNVRARDKPFKTKKEAYEKHRRYKITEDLINIDVWNIDAIIKRHDHICGILKTELDLYRIVKYLNKEYLDGILPADVL